MALTDVRTYFRGKLDALGYSEWSDGFNSENIPQSLLDKSYHLEIGTITSATSSHLTYTFSYPLTVKIFLKGYVDPSGAIDDAILQSESILASILDTASRVGLDIKDVIPGTVDVLQFDASNDNDLILQMEFISIIMCVF